VAGGNGPGNALNQLNSSYGVFVDSTDAVFVTDDTNHREVKWEKGASSVFLRKRKIEVDLNSDDINRQQC
jgi:hypothetical protein